MTSGDGNRIREWFLDASQELKYSSEKKPVEWFTEHPDIDEEIAHNHLDALVESGEIERYTADDGSPLYGPPEGNTLTPQQLHKRIQYSTENQLRSIDWLAIEMGVSQDTVRNALQTMLEPEEPDVESYEMGDTEEVMVGPPGLGQLDSEDQFQTRRSLSGRVRYLKRTGEKKPVEWFVQDNIEREAVFNHLDALVESGEAEEYTAEDGSALYGPPGVNDLSSNQIRRRVLPAVKNLTDPRSVDWLATETNLSQDAVRNVLKTRLERYPGVETYQRDDTEEVLFGPPGLDDKPDTVQLREDRDGNMELVFPDGRTELAETKQAGGFIIASEFTGEFVSVFRDGNLIFTFDESVKSVQSIAVTHTGYLAYHTGEHREQVFNLATSEGEILLQRVSGVARTPTFTPDGDYVAYWRLVDNTIYSYDVAGTVDAGNFDTSKFRTSNDVGRSVNIGVEGVEYKGEPAFKICDTYGPGGNELLGYISPQGELIESVQ